MTALRLVVVTYLFFLLTIVATGCGCTCAVPRPAPPAWSAPPSSASVAAPAASRVPAERAPSYYDRYREERHRREVEKQLRDIKRNTQRSRSAARGVSKAKNHS
jgi:hypothetical protein